MAEEINALATDIRDWLSLENWRLIESKIGKYGFGYAIGTRRISNNIDQGKGGWSNLIQSIETPSVKDDAYIYLAPDVHVANAFCIADECGDDRRMAIYLGIPRCCADFFLMVWPAASRHQGDLCPYSCAMSENHPYPWDWRTNVVSQYYGGSLISFFPCSFHCSSAKMVGEDTFKVLSRVNRDWAESFKTLSKGVFLYTEYGGVHRWGEYTIEGKQILLSGKAQSTVDDNLISHARIIEYKTPHDMIVHTESQVFHLSGADVALFIF